MCQKSVITGVVLMAAMMMCLTFSIAAENNAQKQEGRPASETIVYQPPQPDCGKRIGGDVRGLVRGITRGVTRGTEEKLPALKLLVPDHTGLTTQDQPVLYWHLSDPTSKRLEFTLNDEKAQKTVFELTLPSDKKGICSLKLADHKVRLSPDTEYSWFISMIVNPDMPSGDMAAGGYIRHVASPASLAGQLEKAEKTEIPAIYAREGMWYDALATLSQLIEASPQDEALKAQRQDLLKQVGIDL